MRGKITLLLLTFLYPVLIAAQNQRETDNLYALAKLYGYVQYFYPGDEAAAANWESIAYAGVRDVIDSQNPEELKSRLNRLFKPIAPALQLYNSTQKATFDLASITPPDTAGFKTVSWQHMGLRIENKTYKSQRTNRHTEENSGAAPFGTTQKTLSAENYRGKEFVLTAKVKIEKGSGSGHLWMRVDTPKGMGFFDNMGNRPVKAEAGWVSCEIKGTVNADAMQLAFGIFLSGGEEQLLADNLELKINEGGSWMKIANDDFEKEDEAYIKLLNNHNPNYVFAVLQDTDKQDNHLLSIRKSNTANSKTSSLLFPEYNRPGEYIRKDLNKDLTCIMPLALFGTKEATWPQSDPQQLRMLTNELAAIPDSVMHGGDLYTRLANVIVTWNIFQHFYPYFDITEVDWDKELRVALQRSFVDNTASDHLNTLQQLTAKLKDGHVTVYSSVASEETYSAPLRWEWVENKLIVTEIIDPSITNIKTGERILAIDNQTPEGWFERIEKNISAATEGWMKYRASTVSLHGKKESDLNLKVENADGSQKAVTLKRTLSMADVRKASISDTVKVIENGIYYLNLDLVNNKMINHLLPELSSAKGIICDLRGYPKNSPQLIMHLLTAPDTSSKWMQIPQFIYPDQEKPAGYKTIGWRLTPKTPTLNAKVVFITDGRAISYAESYLGLIKHYKLATIVGQPTAGSNGDINPFNLPGGYNIPWTGMKVLKLDGSQHHGIGVLPDVYVEKTVRGIREGRDEFLEKALEIVRKE